MNIDLIVFCGGISMNAWLLTWEGVGGHAELTDTFIAIMGSRKSSRAIAGFY